VGRASRELISGRKLGKLREAAIRARSRQKAVEEIAAQIETFGRYGFNKFPLRRLTRSSPYQTAWFKAYYPAEYMAALLSSEIGTPIRVVQYINEARELRPAGPGPDVNESGYKFTLSGTSESDSGWAPCGTWVQGAIASIIAGDARRTIARSWRLCDRHRPAAVQQRVIESLIDSGACDFAGGERSRCRRPRPRLQRKRRFARRNGSPDSTPCSATQPQPRVPSPPPPSPMCRPWNRTERWYGEERARLLHFRPPLAKYPPRWSFLDPHGRHPGHVSPQKVTVAASSRW